MSDYVCKLNEDIDYDYVYSEDEPDVNIKLLTGDFKDITVRFGKISVDEDGGSAILNFSYEIIDANGSLFLEDNDDFKNHLGDVLTSIIWKNMIQYKNDEVVE